MMKPTTWPIGLTIGLLAMAATAGADIYRWTDAQGRVHYSDRPAAENAEHVAISRPTNPQTVAQRNEATQERLQKTENKEQQQQADQATAKAVQEDVAKTRAEQCEKAKKDYKVTVESQRLYRVGKDGERQYLTDTEIAESRINARKAMDELCKEK